MSPVSESPRLLFTVDEVIETVQMIDEENLDIRAVTLALSIMDCAAESAAQAAKKIREKILRYGSQLVPACDETMNLYGIPIINKRLTVTPLPLVGGGFSEEEFLLLANAMDGAALEIGIDFIGGYSAFAHAGVDTAAARLMSTIPRALASTQTIMSAVNVASTRSGINMDAVRKMAEVIVETAWLTKDRNAIGCGRLAVFANLPDNVPFMPGAVHTPGHPDCEINVGISGPGVIRSLVLRLPEADLGQLAEEIKKTAFKITRMGDLIGRRVAQRMGVAFGSVDLSIAPTTRAGDSVAEILEAMGLETCGGPGTTAALMLFNDAVKKGGLMATSCAGGFSGAFIPVSEDAGMMRAVQSGALTLEKLEAMTSVCAVGLDMIAIPGDTTVDTIAAIIADEMAIGVANQKTTGARIIPVPGRSVGDIVRFEGHKGLLGETVVMPVSRLSPAGFIRRGGRIPAPIHSLRN